MGFLLPSDISNELVKPFLSTVGTFEYYLKDATDTVVSYCQGEGIPLERIPVDSDGRIISKALRDYCLNCFYLKLIGDKKAKGATTDPANSFYYHEIVILENAERRLLGKLSCAEILGHAYSRESKVSHAFFQRG